MHKNTDFAIRSVLQKVLSSCGSFVVKILNDSVEKYTVTNKNFRHKRDD